MKIAKAIPFILVFIFFFLVICISFTLRDIMNGTPNKGVLIEADSLLIKKYDVYGSRHTRWPEE